MACAAGQRPAACSCGAWSSVFFVALFGWTRAITVPRIWISVAWHFFVDNANHDARPQVRIEENTGLKNRKLGGWKALVLWARNFKAHVILLMICQTVCQLDTDSSPRKPRKLINIISALPGPFASKWFESAHFSCGL